MLPLPPSCGCVPGGVAARDPLAPRLHAGVADELRMVAALIEQLAEALVGDEQFAARHIDELQTFDLVIQCAEESAAVLDRLAEGADAHRAIAPVRLAAVQERLRHALGTVREGVV